MSDQNPSENLEDLAKTDPEAFLNYWRATLSAEQYERLAATVWREYMQRQIWYPNPVYRRLHLKTVGDDLNALLETQIERGLRGEYDIYVVTPEAPGWFLYDPRSREQLASTETAEDVFTNSVNRIASAFGLPEDQLAPKAPDETPRDSAGDSLD